MTDFPNTNASTGIPKQSLLDNETTFYQPILGFCSQHIYRGRYNSTSTGLKNGSYGKPLINLLTRVDGIICWVIYGN